MSITYPDACGIDINATSHFVAVPPERDDEPVRKFPAFTADLERLVQWLRRCRVTAVAMESTGVYWIPLFEMLDAAGFEVHLVNARHVRNVPGRKSDVLDCQWLQQLMSYGLLRGGFRPAEEVCALRAVWRHRDMLLSYQARHVQHLQKAMTQMNVQLHHVISDIMGVPAKPSCAPSSPASVMPPPWPSCATVASRLTRPKSPQRYRATGATSTCLPCSKRWP